MSTAAESLDHVDCDVLVIGLGPVGQLLTLLLARRGLSVIAIDQAEGIHELPRAAVIDDEVLRILQSAGVAEDVLADSQVQEEVSFVTDGGRPMTLLEPVGGIQGHHPLVSIHQPSIERVLVAAAEAQESAELRWGCRLDRIEQGRGRGAAVTAFVGPGGRERIRARWAVGCDGGPSRVRQLLGIELGGFTFRQRWLVVDVRLDRPLARVGHPHFFGDWRRPIVSLPMSPGRHRWEWMLHPGEEERVDDFLDRDSIRERLEPWLADEQAEIERAVVYTFHARFASRWREGRVFLAGDAAHLMPPFAGQGFSSGARDAANLAWKLEAVVRGAPESLLDTYEAERRPHVQAMTRLALAIGRFVQTTDRRVAKLRDAFLTGLEASGIAAWARERIKPVPAYGDGAFAGRPARLASRRGVGSQFPQPRVGHGGEQQPLDEVVGPGWCAIATGAEQAAALGAEGLRVLLVGRDIEDPERTIGEWLERHGAQWVVLRPDRFVFALGAGTEECGAALDAIHRQAGSVAPARVPVAA